jgi:hypothetical protein
VGGYSAGLPETRRERGHDQAAYPSTGADSATRLGAPAWQADWYRLGWQCVELLSKGNTYFQPLRMVFYTQAFFESNLEICGMPQRERRRRIVATALDWMKTAQVEPSAYEQWLLGQYSSGEYLLGQVIELLEGRAAQRSQAARAGYSLSLSLKRLNQYPTAQLPPYQ